MLLIFQRDAFRAASWVSQDGKGGDALACLWVTSVIGLIPSLLVVLFFRLSFRGRKDVA